VAPDIRVPGYPELSPGHRCSKPTISGTKAYYGHRSGRVPLSKELFVALAVKEPARSRIAFIGRGPGTLSRDWATQHVEYVRIATLPVCTLSTIRQFPAHVRNPQAFANAS
jgi:hypothetical protein